MLHQIKESHEHKFVALFFVLPRAQVQAVDGTGREQGGPAKQGKQSAQWAVA